MFLSTGLNNVRTSSFILNLPKCWLKNFKNQFFNHESSYKFRLKQFKDHYFSQIVQSYFFSLSFYRFRNEELLCLPTCKKILKISLKYFCYILKICTMKNIPCRLLNAFYGWSIKYECLCIPGYISYLLIIVFNYSDLFKEIAYDWKQCFQLLNAVGQVRRALTVVPDLNNLHINGKTYETQTM